MLTSYESYPPSFLTLAHLGTGQSLRAQLLACRLRSAHIFLHIWHPPVTLSWQATACWNSMRTCRRQDVNIIFGNVIDWM
jgi:hypothetical protein